MNVLFLALAVFASALLGVETPAPVKSISLAKCTAPPVIDGVLNEAEWQCAKKLALNYQVLPGDNAEPSERTEVFITYDTQHLYLAFRAHDRDPAAIRARMARRDNVFEDDYVAVFLDTFNDRRRAYALYFNPFGVQADGIFIPASLTATTPANASEIKDLTWDGIFTSKGALTADGYVVEVAIPFKTLRFQSGKEMTWGLHVHRWIPRKVERIYWQPLSRDQSELLVQMGTLGGMQEVFAGRTLDLTPTLTGSVTTDRAPALAPNVGARFINKGLVDPGVTATWTVTPNLTFSGTINPDFSQIEADVPQIDANQRFPLFFPERRPFFLEGDDVFRSGGLLTFVFTRQLVDPDWGAKLTGKIGKHTIGVLSASDRAPGLRVATTEQGFGENAQFNIVRYQRDVLRDSRIGAFVLDRRWAGASNTVIANDGQIRFRGVNTIGWQAAMSRTRAAAGAESDTGYAGYVWHEHRGRHLRAFTNNLKITNDYRAQTGFVRRTGFNQTSGNYGYEFQSKEKSWWVSVRPFIVPRLLRTDDGRIDESYADPGASLYFARGINFYVYHSWKRDSFAGRNFRYEANIAHYTINSFKKITFDYDIGMSFGSFGLARPTFDFTGALNENKSLLYRLNFAYERGDGFRDFGKNRSVFVAPALTWKLSNKTTLTTEFEYQRYRHTFDSGLPSTDQNFLSQPVNRFYGEPFNQAINKQGSLTINLTHQFTDNWSLRSGLNAINSQSDTVYANFFGANATQVNRVSYITEEFSENYGSQNELYGRFSTGAIKHQLVAGLELVRYAYTYTFDFDFGGFPAINRNNPVYGTKQLNRANYSPFFGDRSRSNALGLYVLDQITLAPRVKLQLGLRGDLVNSRQWEVVAARPINAQNDQAITPRAGIVVNPTDSTAVYFSFARSFLPTFGSGRSRTGETFQPITGRLFEVGVKQNLLNNRLFATLALYQLKRQNVLTPDPDDPTRRFNIQTGEQESKGVEVELTGQITSNWNTSINYTATDAFVSKDNRLRVGSKLLGVSKHSGGVYTNYEFARGAVRGFSLGGGLYGFSPVFAGLPNPLWRIPGYVRADVNFGYRRDHFRAQVAIKNINDKKYFLAQGASNLVPQAPRHVVASVGYTF